MNVGKIFSAGSQERVFQLKAKRDAGIDTPRWQEPQFLTCKKCERRATRQVWAKSLYVCPNCGHHQPIGGYYRLSLVLDHGTFKELDAEIDAKDVLEFPGYPEKLGAQKAKTGLQEAVVTAHRQDRRHPGRRRRHGQPLLHGQHGHRRGRKDHPRGRVCHRQAPAAHHLFGQRRRTRMQEGIFSLMQMAKTSAAIQRFSQRGGLYISCLTHPTTGGVTASFASLGDIMLAEPGALIGFAGPRVIEQTIGEKLPKGFQTAEFQTTHGFVDQVVPRAELKRTLALLLQLHTQGRKHGA